MATHHNAGQRALAPTQYLEKVYAGVLGKIIGVYLGRPFEGWSHQRIIAELGEITGYVRDRFKATLVVTDDDIAGTFTFLRAMEDNGFDPNLTPAQIGETWLDYLIEQQTVLWWGGVGTSTEHTAYMRLKQGIPAPASGSIARNGTTISEQIGAQIFIDGWAMLFPGDPERAADVARRAASVSHDGEAVFAAQVIAAIEALAFVEKDINRLIDTAVSLTPNDSTIARLIHDVRAWHAHDADWYVTRARIEERYGYHRYPGACHVVPNHALIINALLHGNGDFSRSLAIVNTSGWDTDCNSGNVGAILGIRNGLEGIDAGAVDWRRPVADRMYLSTADGGRAITDAVTESVRIVQSGLALRGEPGLELPDARYRFSLPGSLQGFQADDPAALDVRNVDGQLSLSLLGDSPAAVRVATFIPPEALELGGYTLFASPALYPGQRVVAEVSNPGDTGAMMTPFIRYYGEGDCLVELADTGRNIEAGNGSRITWTIPDVGGHPIAGLGFRLHGPRGTTVHVDHVHWSGAPDLTLGRPGDGSTMWRRAWVQGVDHWSEPGPADYQISQNSGIGLLSQGSEDWQDYAASARINVPLAKSAGLAVRVVGLRRYYALLIGKDHMARLVKARGARIVLAETPLTWDPERTYDMAIEVRGNRIRGTIDGMVVLEAVDTDHPLPGGGVALVVEEGTLASGPVTVSPR